MLSSLFCLLTGFSVTTTYSCSEFRGIGESPDDYYTMNDLINIPQEGIYNIWNQHFTETDLEPTSFRVLETPMQARVLPYDFILFYNVLAMFEEIPIDFFGRKELSNQLRRCEVSQSNERTDLNTDLFYLHRSVAFLYTIYYDIILFYPLATDYITEQILSVGLDIDICDGDKYYESNCSDPSTPWGLAFKFVSELNIMYVSDGFNHDGSYSREYNKIPFQDFRDKKNKYIPKNSPWELKFEKNWQPLLVTDELGFLYYQEHVTPHIGYTGRSWFFTDDEICERSKWFKEKYGDETVKNYDYDKEIDLLLNRLEGLTESMKMEIEYFDFKGNLGGLLVQYLFGLKPIETRFLLGGYDSFGVYAEVIVYLTSVYEGVLAVWKEKIDYDRVRPTSIIQKRLKNKQITTYAGTTPDGETFGTQTFYGKDFEPYIYTMPHSEYPSASACLCIAWSDGLTEYFKLTGDGNITDTFPDGLQATFTAGSSEYEPLSTPSEDITIFYKDWKDIANRCAETRLEGGMHFTPSVPDGINLCKNNIGPKVAKYMYDVVNGIEPESYKIDPDNLKFSDRKCYPKKSKSSGGNDGKKDKDKGN